MKPLKLKMKIFIALAWVGLASAFVILATIIFWMVYPYTPISFIDKTFAVNKDTVYQGKSISYSTKYCKYMDLNATVTREFRNELVFVTPSTISNRALGCHTVNIQVVIPQELLPGTYYMRQRYEYQVNPIRTITIIEDTNPFIVLEATPSAR